LAEVERVAGVEELVDAGVVAPEVVEFGRAEEGDVSVGIEFAEAVNGGHGHDGVANPVNAADEDVFLAGAGDGGLCWGGGHR
jgi:hypothetical protein